MTAPLVDVITPLYNCAPWLDQCIASVRSQSYQNWRMVILNNCSTDGSGDIAERHAAEDSRIRVVHADTFIGQVHNVNRSMRLISADSVYCKPLLADDWLHPRCLEEMVALAVTDPNIGVVGSLSVYRGVIAHRGIPYSERAVLRGHDAMRAYLLNDDDASYFLGSPTGVMYRSDLIRKKEFLFPEENRFFWDVDGCMDLLNEGSFGFVHQVLSYNRRDNSVHWDKWERFGPLPLHVYMLLKKYGRSCMSNGEFETRWKDAEGRYYGMLARGVLNRQSEEFWAMHQEGMDIAGMKLDMLKVYWRVATRLADAALNPKRTFDRWLAG